MAAAKPAPQKASKPPVLKQKSVGMKIIFPGLRKDNGAVSITTEALVELRAAFQKMKGQELRAALEEVVLFAKYLLENLKSPKAANALLDVANAAVSAGAFAPAGAPAWKSSKK